MPDQGAEDNPADEFESETNHKKRKQFLPLWLSNVVFGYICAAVGTLCGCCGGALLNSRPKPVLLAWLLIFVALVFLAFATRSWLVNHRNRQVKNKMPIQTPNWVCLSIILLALGICSFAIVQEEKTLKPHVRLYLEVGENVDSVIPLTNDFLFNGFVRLSQSRTILHITSDGCIVIPVEATETNKVLRLIAQNDSDVPINDLIIQIGLPKEPGYTVDSSWHKANLMFHVSTLNLFMMTNLQSWMITVPWTLFPGDLLTLPAITNPCVSVFGPMNANSGASIGSLMAAMKATGIEDGVSANIIFMQRSILYSKPFVIRGTLMPDGKLSIPVTIPYFPPTQTGSN